MGCGPPTCSVGLETGDSAEVVLRRAGGGGIGFGAILVDGA